MNIVRPGRFPCVHVGRYAKPSFLLELLLVVFRPEGIVGKADWGLGVLVRWLGPMTFDFDQNGIQSELEIA